MENCPERLLFLWIVSLCMSKRTDTFLFVLIQKISSVGVLPEVVLYGCVTLLMTSFDVQQHHGAARHFTSVSAIVQPSECVKEGTNSVELGYTRNYTHTMGLMWGESG